MISERHCRAARALLGISQEQLAASAGVGLSTVRDFETLRRELPASTVHKIRLTLERAGVEFVFGGRVGVVIARRA